MFDFWSTSSASEHGTIEQMTTQGTALSLFSGAGGLDLGVEAVGFTTAAAVEVNNDAADTMEKNFSSLVSPVIRRASWKYPPRTAAGGRAAWPRAP